MDEVNCAGGHGLVHDLITCCCIWWYYPPTEDEFSPPSEPSRLILCTIHSSYVALLTSTATIHSIKLLHLTTAGGAVGSPGTWTPWLTQYLLSGTHHTYNPQYGFIIDRPIQILE